jgi:hypothetical protein
VDEDSHLIPTFSLLGSLKAKRRGQIVAEDMRRMRSQSVCVWGSQEGGKGGAANSFATSVGGARGEHQRMRRQTAGKAACERKERRGSGSGEVRWGLSRLLGFSEESFSLFFFFNLTEWTEEPCGDFKVR